MKKNDNKKAEKFGNVFLYYVFIYLFGNIYGKMT